MLVLNATKNKIVLATQKLTFHCQYCHRTTTVAAAMIVNMSKKKTME